MYVQELFLFEIIEGDTVRRITIAVLFNFDDYRVLFILKRAACA